MVLVDYEDDLEGSFWRLGHDLGDLYRDQITIRQLWIRVKTILGDLDSPLRRAIEADRRDREEQAEVDAIDDAIANVT